MPESEVVVAVRRFGQTVAAKFAVDGGEPEDHLRGPLENLLADLAAIADVGQVVASGEHHLADERIRPDYAVHVGGALVGFLEVKAPGKGADPSRFRGHDKKQWERLSCLPNVLYTDGECFGLYRDGERVGEIVRLTGSVETSGASLGPPTSGSLTGIVEDFLRWEPVAPKRPKELAGIAARLCRLLRAEVEELLATDEGLQALADDWRRLLFPTLSDAEFADAYAQTVTFGLLLARVEGIDLSGESLQDIAVRLSERHTLVGRALDLLTDPQVLGKLAVSVRTLQRVLSVVDWPTVSKGRAAAWLYFYEEFLDVYDPALRKATGSYYTPVEVVDPMVRLVDELLRDRLGHPSGLASPGVEVVDPGTGSGTFLVRIIEHIAQVVTEEEGLGAVSARLNEAAGRLVGFELQAGPYSVAELRLAAEFARNDAAPPPGGLRLFLADTLSNPFEEEQNLGAQYLPIVRSRRNANQVKATDRVRVVIGNPPYKEKSRNKGGWIEKGNLSASQAAPLLDFVPPRSWGLGSHVKHLYNLYVYFWRWATWKVFDGHPDDRGIVAFITVAGFLNGPGFGRMRDYLRRTSDAIWVIDCSPEGHQPEVSTRVFQGVQQPVCIVLVVKDGTTDADSPAPVRFTALTGHREDKFAQLHDLRLDGDPWRNASDGWTDGFLPAPSEGWMALPEIADIFPGSSSGLSAHRVWPISPSRSTLAARMGRLLTEPDMAVRARLLGETRDTKLTTVRRPLPGFRQGSVSLAASSSADAEEPVRYGIRSFDRSWVLPDARLLHDPRRSLWNVLRAPGQVFMTVSHDRIPENGPAATYTTAMPDQHHYHGRGGRVIPLWLDSEGLRANVLPGLSAWLSDAYAATVNDSEVFAYAAAVLGSPAFLRHFAEDFTVPGLRLPITANHAAFKQGVAVGERLLWLHTYGERYVDESAGRPSGRPRLPDSQRPLVTVGIPFDESGMPEELSFDPQTQQLRIGVGRIGPVLPQVWDYEVGGLPVVKRWFDRRRKNPEADVSSPLDEIVPTTWEPEWTSELLEMLNVLTLVVEEEQTQAELLEQIVGGPLFTVADLTAAGILPLVNPPSIEQPPRSDGQLPGI